MSSTLWPIAAVVIALIGMLVSIGTFVRAGQWRATDDGRKVLHRLGNVEMNVRGLEVQAQSFAKQADVARIEGRLDGLEKMLAGAVAGVERIEQFLMGRAGQ